MKRLKGGQVTASGSLFLKNGFVGCSKESLSALHKLNRGTAFGRSYSSSRELSLETFSAQVQHIRAVWHIPNVALADFAFT